MGIVRFIALSIMVVLVTANCTGEAAETEENCVDTNLQDFVDLRYGMFICYNIMSYGAQWGEANYDISTFNPVNLDCDQWAEAAEKAKMKFGVLTAKHHEGFCLWDSETTTYDVASTPYKKDVVRQYVDAFRARNLKIGLYYSIWDSTHGIDKDSMDEKNLAFVKKQLEELLTNYGKIDYLVIDGWFWRMGHHEISYNEMREFIESLQPGILVTDHTHLQAPYHVDIPYFEGPFGAFPDEGNRMASALGHCSFPGNGWFWSEKTAKGPNDDVPMILDKLTKLESRYCNFLLNCMPNREGLLDSLTVRFITEIGEKWSPDADRNILEVQDDRMTYSYPIESAKASSGNSSDLIDARQYKTDFKHWEASSDSMQVIELDLGVNRVINRITLVSNHRTKPHPEVALEKGNVMKVNTHVSKDGISFSQVSSNVWDEKAAYRAVRFGREEARYVKLEILEAIGGRAVIAEVEVGMSDRCDK